MRLNLDIPTDPLAITAGQGEARSAPLHYWKQISQ